MSPSKIAEIHFPEDIYSYKIVECGVNTEVYDSVSVTGIDDTKIVKEQTPGNTARYSYATPWDTAENRKTVEFNNHVNAEGLRTLSVTKVLLGEDGNEAYDQNAQSVHVVYAERRAALRLQPAEDPGTGAGDGVQPAGQ